MTTPNVVTPNVVTSNVATSNAVLSHVVSLSALKLLPALQCCLLVEVLILNLGCFLDCLIFQNSFFHWRFGRIEIYFNNFQCQKSTQILSA
jgi:hypothetical protein